MESRRQENVFLQRRSTNCDFMRTASWPRKFQVVMATVLVPPRRVVSD